MTNVGCAFVYLLIFVQNGGYIYFPRSEFSGSSIYTHVCECICVCVCIYIYMCVCVCVCVYRKFNLDKFQVAVRHKTN